MASSLTSTTARLRAALERPPVLALALLSIVLLALPLTTHKPGLPATLKADEPAYYLASLSLAYDFDLKVEQKDLERAFVEYPYLSVQNLIVMSDDGFRTLHYGKPYLFPLLAAPFAAVLGSDGMVLFNMVLLVAMVWAGFFWLRRRAGDTIHETAAALFSAGFFVLGYGFVYVFWLHPEVLNMAATAFCLYWGLPGGRSIGAEASGRRPAGLRTLRLVLSAAALAVGTYNKPMLAAFGVPVLVAAARDRRWRDAAVWIASAALSMAVFAGLSIAWTGQPTAYLVDLRAGFTLIDPTEPLVEPLPEVAAEAATEESGQGQGREASIDERGSAGWWWLLRLPETTRGELAESVGYFLVGRHTGLLVYLPFALLCLLYFGLHGLRDPVRWTVLLATAGVGLFFLLFISFNWHGGGGFVGNRYFVMATPALLFLVPRIAPTWPLVPAYLVAGLLIGPLVVSPYGLVAPAPTLQIHARNPPFAVLPIELSLNEIPGHEGVVQNELWLWGRRDMVRANDEILWLRGGRPAVAWLMADRPLERPRFRIRSSARPNRATLCLVDDCTTVELGIEPVEIELAPSRPSRVRRARALEDRKRFYDLYVYRLEADVARAEMPRWHGDEGPTFPLGLEILHLGDSASAGSVEQ